MMEEASKWRGKPGMQADLYAKPAVHAPDHKGATLVHTSDDLYLISTPCVCGDNNCGFTISVYPTSGNCTTPIKAGA
jgi:hypothetical protein